MDTKIQALTEKIYHEGVEKGNEEAAKIIAQAKTQADTIRAEAEAEAKRITTEADKQALDRKKNTEAEIKLFATQALEALKSSIIDIINGKITTGNVQAAITDKSFVQKVILEMAREWVKSGALTIQSADAQTLTAYFEANAKDILDKGVRIEKVNGKDTSFALVPADGSYKVTFGEEEFVTFFKEFLRPQLVELLF
jgi:V/A-type H+-transporting ATPase subunit E